MTTCVVCGEYFRLSPWHTNKLECQNCTDVLHSNYVDDDLEIEKTTLLNPSGKTKPVFYDDGYNDDEDSHGL